MAKAKSTKKKTSRATAKTKKKAAPQVRKAKAAAPAKRAKAKTTAKAKGAKPKPAPRPQPAKPAAPSETNWTDAIKAALERRSQQPGYPGSGSNSWKNRPKQ